MKITLEKLLYDLDSQFSILPDGRVKSALFDYYADECSRVCYWRPEVLRNKKRGRTALTVLEQETIINHFNNIQIQVNYQ